MKWRNSKERELIAQGGCREQTLPTKNNPNPDLSDPQTSNHNIPPQPSNNHHLEAMAKTRLAFNETLWTLPPPLLQDNSQTINEDEASDINEEDEDLEEEEEISVT